MMEPLDNNAGITTPSPQSSNRLAELIIGTQILIALLSYPFLPEIVPSHWNAAGQVNGYMPKPTNAILLPAVSIGCYLLLRGLMALSPTLGNQDRHANQTVMNLIVALILLFLLVVQIMIVAIGLGVRVDVSLVMTIAVSVLFILIGNYLGKLRRNFWAGIRTPWTMVSDKVWERTHRLGGWLFVATGLVGLLTSLLATPWRLFLLIGLVVGVAIFLVVYSYVLYQRLEKGGENPLSPPFDNPG